MKKLLALLLLLAVVVMGIASCDLPTTGGTGGNTNDGTGDGSGDGTGDGEGGAGSNEPVDYGTATVYTPGTEVHIVAINAAGNSAAEKLANSLDVILLEDNGGGATVVGQYAENTDYEIILNFVDESRPITQKAQQLLERMDKDGYFQARVLAYAEGGKIAFAYDENEYTNLQAISVAIDEFIADYIRNKDYVALGEGIVYQDTIDLIAEQDVLDRVQVAKEWEDLEAALVKGGYTKTAAADVVEALRHLYTMYDDSMIDWMANLYDPGVGGYYGASSGRDYEGYGPDVQCTVQLLRFIASSGMVKNISSKQSVFIPEFMQQQMIYFAKSLQKSNGYYYHPQWAAYDIDNKFISRRGRDLGWGTSLLSMFNALPVYNTPDGYSGDGVTADEYWESLGDKALSEKPHSALESPTFESIKNPENITSKLGTSVASAVSKVVLAADTSSGTAYLSTHQNFINYLLGTVTPGMQNDQYVMGNNLNATDSQIANYSKQLGAYTYTSADPAEYAQFDGMTLKEMLIFHLNNLINDDIGLWGTPSAAKNETGTEFKFTNGFFKVISTYNSWKYAYPAEHIAKVADTLSKAIVSEQQSKGNACDVYNIWCAIGYVRSNLKATISGTCKYLGRTDALTEDEITSLKALLETFESAIREKAAEGIITTYEKMSGYRKSDGGFSHSWTGGPSNHQGLPIAIGGILESDVDATCIASTGLINNVMSGLGYGGYKVSMYTESDWMRYLEILLAQQPVIKYSYDAEAAVKYHDFEDGLPASYITFVNNSLAENTFTAVTLNGDGVGFMSKQGAKQGYFDFKPNVKSLSGNTAYFEADLMFDNVTKGDPVELRMYSAASASAATTMYKLMFDIGTSGDKTVSIYPTTDSSTKVAIAKQGEWFTLRLQYFVGDDSNPSCFKVFINNNETPVIVDHAYTSTYSGSSPAAGSVGLMRLVTMENFRGSLYMDDLTFSQERITSYVSHAPTHNKTNTGTTPGGSDDSGSSGNGGSSSDSGTTPSTPVFDSDPSGELTFDNLADGFFQLTSVGDLLINQPTQANAISTLKIVSENGVKYLEMNKSAVDGTSNGQTWLVVERSVSLDDKTQPLVFETSIRHTQIKNANTYFRFYEGRTAASGSNGTKIGGNVMFAPSGANLYLGGNLVGKAGEWFTLRLVLSGTTISVYSSNESGKMTKVGDITFGGDVSNASTIVLMNDTTTLHKTDFNYIYFGRNAALATSEDPLHPVTPNVSSGGTTETPSTPDTPVTPDTPTPTGPVTFDAIEEGDFALDEARDSVLIGKANQSAEVVSSLKIVADGDNKYLAFDKEVNAPDANGEIKNRMCWLVLERTEEAGADGVLYFEAKLNLTSKNTNKETQIRFYTGRTAAAPGSGGTQVTNVKFYASGDKVYLNGVEIGAASAWISVRFVMGAESTTVYVLDAEGKWVESSTIAVAGLNAINTVQYTMMSNSANTLLIDDIYFGPSYSDTAAK